MKPIEFNMSSIEDDDIRRLCRWAVGHASEWLALTDWLVDFVGGEALRRRETPDDPSPHYITTPFADWTDRDVGRALSGVTRLSYAENVGEQCGKLLDMLVIHVSAEASHRLEFRTEIAAN